MNINPMQLINMIKGGLNPQQLLMNVLNQQGNNPILQNAMNMANSGNVSGLEMIAKNLASQRGINFEESTSNLKNMLQQ